MLTLTYRLLAGLFCVATLISCDAFMGKEVARATFTEVVNPAKPEYQSVQLQLTKGEKIRFWTEMDLEYDGILGLEFEVAFAKTLNINPLRLNALEKDVSMGEVKTVVGEHTKWRFSGRIGSFEVPVAGNYDIGVMLLSSNNPTLKLKKAVLVFKK